MNEVTLNENQRIELLQEIKLLGAMMASQAGAFMNNNGPSPFDTYKESYHYLVIKQMLFPT